MLALFIMNRREMMDSMDRAKQVMADLDATTTPQLLERLEAAKLRTQKRANRWWRAARTKQRLLASLEDLDWEMDIIRRTYAEHPVEECAILRKARARVENQIIDDVLASGAGAIAQTPEVTRPNFAPTLCTCNGVDPKAQRRAEEEWRDEIMKGIPDALRRMREIAEDRRSEESDFLDE